MTMIDAALGQLPPELIFLPSADQTLFDRIDGVLCDALARIHFKNGSGSGDANLALEIRELIFAGNLKDAYERLYGVVKENDLSEYMFLGLAVTNLYLSYPEAASKYAGQAAKLHSLVGGGAHADLLQQYSKILHDLMMEWQASKITINDRFINLYPTQSQLERSNAVDKFIMGGLTPPEPFITRHHRIATVGSCFAGNISSFLRVNGYDVPMLNTEYVGKFSTGSFSDEVFNTYVLRYLFEVAFGDSDVAEFRSVNQHNHPATLSVDDIRRTLRGMDIFIITLGLAEVWFNKQTGEVFQTAKSVGEYDPDLHDFRVTSVQENLDNIEFVYRSIRQNLKDARIVFTLSPVPLKATFRSVNCTVANSVSKAILRVALDELIRAHQDDAHLFYFPSYELLTDCLPRPFGPDRRYIGGETLDFVTSLFAKHYLVFDRSPD
jgi:hypothetical protein